MKKLSPLLFLVIFFSLVFASAQEFVIGSYKAIIFFSLALLSLYLYKNLFLTFK